MDFLTTAGRQLRFGCGEMDTYQPYDTCLGKKYRVFVWTQGLRIQTMWTMFQNPSVLSVCKTLM